jgi:hypothetical protein
MNSIEVHYCVCKNSLLHYILRLIPVVVSHNFVNEFVHTFIECTQMYVYMHTYTSAFPLSSLPVYVCACMRVSENTVCCFESVSQQGTDEGT